MKFSDEEVLHANDLRLDDPTARELVARWRRATGELAIYIGLRRGEGETPDLVDASTLAAIYVEVAEHG